jgi:thioredoxin 1
MKRLILFLTILAAASVASAETKLLDFYADWCGPCKAMAATVDQLASAGYTVERVNVDQDRELAARFGVDSIPCYVVVEQGREVDRIVGKASLERLRQKMQPAERGRGERGIQNRERGERGQSHPAWRYERPSGYRSAVVRIDCTTAKVRQDGGIEHNWGSGVIVRWADRLIVVTAKHVIAGAIRIEVYLHNGRKIPARLIAIRADYECCALRLDGDVGDITPVEVYSQPLTRGEQLESCGYGPNSKLAANAGIFESYANNGGVLNVSGYVRSGDSGGPVFNSHGQVVGVIWAGGGDQEVKQGVVVGNAGRFLSLAIPHPTAFPVLVDIMDPRLPGPVQFAPVQCGPGGCPIGQPCGPSGLFGQRQGQGQGAKRPQQFPDPAPLPEPIQGEDASMLPWRNKIEGDIGDIKRGISALGNAQGQPQVMPPQSSPQPIVINQAPPPAERPGNAIEQKLDDFLHKLPIQGPITKMEEKALESDSWVKRLVGFDATMLVQIIAVIGGLMLAHKLYTTLHSHKLAIDTALAAVPAVGPALAKGFDALDGFNTSKVEPVWAKVQTQVDALKAKVEVNPTVGAAVTDIDAAVAKAKADLTAHVAALNTPAPGQATIAIPLVAQAPAA